MAVVRLTLAYEGTDFHGWQVQPDRSTVQGCLAAVCTRIVGAPVKVVGASRTDAGVHALRQVASVTGPIRLEPPRLARALNALLPVSIRVVDARPAPDGFDARRSALGKRYLYLIDRGAVADPFLRRHAWHAPYRLDVAPMRAALPALLGKHDFSAFCAAPKTTSEMIRNVVNRTSSSPLGLNPSAARGSPRSLGWHEGRGTAAGT